ncbi:hypothetical protein [Vibrio phage LP.1]|nr:hypothetical protein [Vibrio phage LP.1]
MYLGNSLTVSYKTEGDTEWKSIGDLHTKSFTIRTEENNMNKHPHDKLIRKWLDNYDTHVVIALYKGLSIDSWKVCNYPDWDSEIEYKVIRRKHLDVALAFYNDGVEVEYQAFDSKWYELDRQVEPSWADFVEYRIKQKPQPKDGEWWMCMDSDGDIAPAYRSGGEWKPWIGDSNPDGWEVSKVMYKMVQADE